MDLTPEQKEAINDLEKLIETERTLMKLMQLSLNRWNYQIRKIYESAGMPEMYIEQIERLNNL